MSNLPSEKVTEDDECAADVKLNGYPGSWGGSQFLTDISYEPSSESVGTLVHLCLHLP